MGRASALTQAALQAPPEPIHHGDLSFAAGRLVKAALSGRRLQEAPCILHRLATTCGKRPVPRTRQGASPVSRTKARASPGGAARRWKAPRVSADPGSLRGASGEAALGQGSRRDCASGLTRSVPGMPVSPAQAGRAATYAACGPRESGLLQRPHGPDILALTREERAREMGSTVASRPASAGAAPFASESPAGAAAVP
jgi:hypothetical protein